jgi:hypothetical protein
VHPIFAAIDAIAAHCDGCAAASSNTSRTARSRTSEENRPGLAMSPILSLKDWSLRERRVGSVHLAHVRQASSTMARKMGSSSSWH